MEPERSYRIKGLTEFQNGVVFLILATAILLYVAYQIKVGIVYTKSGQLPLGSGLGYGFLTIETVGAVVGIVRGMKMIRS
jgi:hypothetical protein